MSNQMVVCISPYCSPNRRKFILDSGMGSEIKIQGFLHIDLRMLKKKVESFYQKPVFSDNVLEY